MRRIYSPAAYYARVKVLLGRSHPTGAAASPSPTCALLSPPSFARA